MKDSIQEEKLDFYQGTKRGRILRAMTLSDIAYWGADAFIFVIFALFVVNFIEGGSASDVGIAILIYYSIRALSSIPAGRFFDERRGYVDETLGLAFSAFVAGSIYMLLSQASEVWQIWLGMSILGFVSAVNLTSWRVLFYNNIDKAEYGQTVGVYQTAAAIAYGLAAALGGIAGEQFGFDKVLFVGGMVTFLGGIIPLMVKKYIIKG